MGMTYQRGTVWWVKYYRNGRPMRESSGSTKESDAIQLLKISGAGLLADSTTTSNHSSRAWSGGSAVRPRRRDMSCQAIRVEPRD